MTTELIALFVGLASGLGGGMGAEWLRSKSTARTTTVQASSEIHKAELVSDAAFMSQLMERVKSLEAREVERDKAMKDQAEHMTEMLVMVERIGNQYENQRKLSGRVAALLRADKVVDEQTLCDLENIPPFRAVLDGPNAPRREAHPPVSA